MIKRLVRNDHWQFASWYKDRFGLFPALYNCMNIPFRNLASVPNSITGGKLVLRPGTSDPSVYDQVFVARQYEVDLGDPRVIVDAGAHIGFSAVYFASRYPKARIIAMEPEPSNFALLLKNIKGFTNITAIHAGLWSKKANLQIDDSDVATWSFRVSETGSSHGITAFGVRDIMAEFNINKVDVLKIDIEGAELEVLKTSGDWLGDVRTLIIELHDRFQPGCTESLYDALKPFDYDANVVGENTVISNIRIST